MKTLIVVLNLVALSLAAPASVETRFVDTNTVDQLFILAHERQDALNSLQGEVNDAVSGIRTAVSETLNTQARITLGQIENNANEVMTAETEVRTLIEEHDVSHPCFVQLINGLDSATNTMGFAAMNFVRAYHRDVDNIVKSATDGLADYDSVFSTFFDRVTKVFGEKHTYMETQPMIDIISQIYDDISTGWENDKPAFDDISKDLKADINLKNDELATKFKNAEVEVKDSYARIQRAITSVCAANANNFNDQKQYFDPQEFIPKINLN